MPSFSDQIATNTTLAGSDPGGQWKKRQVQGTPGINCVFQRTQYFPLELYSQGVNSEVYWFRCLASDWPAALPVPDSQLEIDGAWYVVTEVIKLSPDIQMYCERNLS